MKKIVLVFITIAWELLIGLFIHGAQATERMANPYNINAYSIAYYETES